MRRITVLAAVALLGSLALGAFAHAITFGENDNGRHPFVGALVYEFQGMKSQGCSGTLVSPTVFVTLMSRVPQRRRLPTPNWKRSQTPGPLSPAFAFQSAQCGLRWSRTASSMQV